MKNFFKKLTVIILGVVAFFLLFGESDGALMETIIMKLVGLASMCLCFELIGKWKMFEAHLSD